MKETIAAVLIVIGGSAAIISVLFIGRSYDELVTVLKQKGIEPDPDMVMWWKGFKHHRLQKEHAPHLFPKQAKYVTVMLTGILLAWAGIYMISTR
jgi:hypothetical protein